MSQQIHPDSGDFLKTAVITIVASRFSSIRTASTSQSTSANPSPFTVKPAATWKNIPSWYIVAANDRAINPDLERFYARRAGAKTTQLKSSHVPFLSQPKSGRQSHRGGEQ